MLDAATNCQAIVEANETNQVVEQIGRALVEAASLVHECSKIPTASEWEPLDMSHSLNVLQGKLCSSSCLMT